MSMGSPVDNRPAEGGPSLCQYRGRWTQKAEPVVKLVGESGPAELTEHLEDLGTIKVLRQGQPDIRTGPGDAGPLDRKVGGTRTQP